MTDPYSVLGVSATATDAEVTRAYRRQLRGSHPDMRCHEPNSAADERLRQILSAYALLRDPTRRAAYDREHPAQNDTAEIRVTVTRPVDPTVEPPLWAGPVHWEP